MKIEATESMLFQGRTLRPGDCVSVPKAFADRAIAKGWAKSKARKPKAKPAEEPAGDAPAENLDSSPE